MGTQGRKIPNYSARKVKHPYHTHSPWGAACLVMMTEDMLALSSTRPSMPEARLYESQHTSKRRRSSRQARRFCPATLLATPVSQRAKEPPSKGWHTHPLLYLRRVTEAKYCCRQQLATCPCLRKRLCHAARTPGMCKRGKETRPRGGEDGTNQPRDRVQSRSTKESRSKS